MGLRQIKIGTRGSALAIRQTEWVAAELKRTYPQLEVEIVKIKTKGDKILDVPLAKVGGKGLFVKEIEDALLKKEIDLAVHSLKDVPTVLPEGLCLGAIPKREDPRDAFISFKYTSLSELPFDARIGTSSLRRQAQLLHLYPGLTIVPLRGNVDTRLRKLKEENLDGIILASAGLKRMGMEDKITTYISPDIMLPAIGQGALGIEIRNEKKWLEFVAPLNHLPTAVATMAERAFLARLEGGCQVPIAAYAVCSENKLHITGLVADTKGRRFFKTSLEGIPKEAEELGKRLADILLEKGAKEVLEEIYAKGG